MRIRYMLMAAATMLACDAPVHRVQAAPPQAEAEALREPMRRLAEALMPAHLAKDQDRDLAALFQLQLVAGRYREAEATLERLAALRRKANPRGAWRLVPWQIYASAKRRAGESGTQMGKAFEQAFQEIYWPFDNKTAVELPPWFVVNAPAARQQLSEAVEACPGASPSCPTAMQLVRSWLLQDAFGFVTPASEPLLQADLRRRFIVDAQVLVPAPDGAKIAAHIVRPRSGPQRVTSLMSFTIYADDWSDAAKMAAHGYAGIVAYSRGKGRSPGPVAPYKHDGPDAAAVIDWIAAQQWSDGRVGMFSGSYNAYTQWAAAKRMPKALKAIATNASAAPGIDTPMERNIFGNYMFSWALYTASGPEMNDQAYSDAARWIALDRNWYLSGRPYRELEKIDGTPNPVFGEWLRHPSYDSYWQRLIPYREDFARIKIPVFVQSGYFDPALPGPTYYMRQHRKHVPNAEHRLLLGPYHHTAMQAGVLNTIQGYDIDEAARIDLADIRLKWFDHVFRGAPLPEILKEKVNFQVMGANTWRHVPSLDAMGNGRMRLYLSDAPDGERRVLSQTKPGTAAATELKVDFKDRSDVDYQPPSRFPGREIDTRNALIFTTPPLPGPLEVNGSFIGRLNVVANKKDLDLSVALYEQLPDGTYFPLASFIGRASYLKDRARRHLLRSGRPQTLAFESDRLTSRRIAPGSRIVATVGVLKQRVYQINYGTGKDVSDESMADAGEPLSISWANDSYLDLNVWR